MGLPGREDPYTGFQVERKGQQRGKPATEIPQVPQTADSGMTQNKPTHKPGGAGHHLSHPQRSSSVNAHACPLLWCCSGTHIHTRVPNSIRRSRTSPAGVNVLDL